MKKILIYKLRGTVIWCKKPDTVSVFLQKHIDKELHHIYNKLINEKWGGAYV